AEGFIGTGMKKDEFVTDCSDIDDIIVFREDGKYSVVKVQDKVFVGKDIIHVAVFKKGDERTIYNAIYRDGTQGNTYVKRFAVTAVTREKEYDVTKETKGSKLLYFTANPNGEAEVVTVQLKPHTKLRKVTFDLDFAEIAIKGKGSMGNLVSKYPVKKITFKSAGVSTLAGRKIWYDDVLKRLNADERGKFLGEFDGDDKILMVFKDGTYELSNFDLSNHFDEKMIRIEKYYPEHVYTAIHQDGKSGAYYVKRFVFDDIQIGKRVSLINEEPGSKLILLTNNLNPVVKIKQLKGKSQVEEIIDQPLNELIDIKKIKAQGNRLSFHNVQSVKALTEDIDFTNPPKQEKEEQSTESSDNPISLEITNPDDIQISDDGQIGLF